MSEDNLNDKPTEEQTTSVVTQAELRELSDEEKQILEDHKKWLESDGKEGKKADLRNANLQKTNLSKANLQKALLAGANMKEAELGGAKLQKTYLVGANLQKAYLSKANLQGANLNRADMQNAVLDNVVGLNKATNLKYANLEGATGLLGNEFAQADVTGTKLPDDIKDFKALETVKETSQNARKIFFGMLLVCLYSWITIYTTTDVRLLTNTASSPLPIIGSKIPIVGFYWTAPFVIICIYTYFHFYLLKLWKGLATLPAIFPDGKRLEERVYPWLLNDLVCRHFEKLKKRQKIAHVKEWVTIGLGWWAVPITMIYFWIRFIPRHDWLGTIFHIISIVLSVSFAIIFYRLCGLTLQGKEKVEFRLQNFWSGKRFYYGVSVALVAVIFSLLSYGAIEGVRPPILKERKIDFFSIKETIPWALKKMGYDVFAGFREKSVSEIPANYGAIAKEERLEFIKGANLKEADLKNADMFRAFLVKADLRWASLNGTNLAQANLQQADLLGANLQKAYLGGANLQKANLELANLQQAYLAGANLQQANLKYANLQKANLAGANLQQANLAGANLQQANLGGANLQQTYLVDSKLQKGYLIRANLQQAQLLRANLQGAYLWRANLQQANLREANLQNANFLSADLTGAKNLTIDQLKKVKILYKAKLDPELLEQVKKCCPQLLEEPKEEKDKKN